MARLWAGATIADVEAMIAGLEASAARGERDTLDRLAGRDARAWAIEELGFRDWAHLEREVTRREILASRDVERLRAMLDADPSLATLEHGEPRVARRAGDGAGDRDAARRGRAGRRAPR
jgi:hypothetical protein